MKNVIIASFSILIALFILQRCTTATGKSDSQLVDMMKAKRDSALKLLKPVLANENLIITSKEDLIGNWTGYLSFSDTTKGSDNSEGEWDMICIRIDSISADSAFGCSIYRGQSHPLTGKYEELAGVYFFDLKHQTKGPYNGEYQLSISSQKDNIVGLWIPNNAMLHTYDDGFNLKKRVFKYDPINQPVDTTVYVDWKKFKVDSVSYYDEDEKKDIFYEEEMYLSTTEMIYSKNASIELLDKSFVENLTKADIFIIRNSIYARHGYAFEYPSLTAFFGEFDWYVPISTDITASLTDIELKNIEILLRYEDYAKEYYDAFGR
ncbi:MAG: YARHG domain-containing protein [Flavobacteriales bacterium]|jgi:hypothetical protein